MRLLNRCGSLPTHGTGTARRSSAPTGTRPVKVTTGVTINVTEAARRSWHVPALIELSAMITVLLTYIWGWQGAFAGASATIVCLYFGIGVLGHVLRRESPRELGLRLDNCGAACRNLAIVVLVGVSVPLAAGAALGSWHFISPNEVLERAPWLILWGTAQQYGLLCFFYRRFLDVFAHPHTATASASLVFAACHLPNPFLSAVTLVAGAVSCTLYRRAPNVFLLGVAHAVISFVLLWALPYSVTHGLRVGPAYLALR